MVPLFDGHEVQIDTHDEPGTVIGEMALLGETWLATVRASRPSHLLALDHEQVVSLLHGSPSAARVILHTLTSARHGIGDASQQAATMTAMRLAPAQLDRSAEEFGPERMPSLGRWLSTSATVQDVDVTEGIDDTLLFLRHRMPPGVQVERVYSQDLPRVATYASELNQVWTNLIENALDAVGGDGTVTVRATQEAPGAVVEVEDDGPGIPPADQARVFDPFFTTKPPGEGAGLGLGTCHHILVRHGGRITVDSRPGRTVFRVELPVNLGILQAPITPAPGESGAHQRRL